MKKNAAEKNAKKSETKKPTQKEETAMKEIKKSETKKSETKIMKREEPTRPVVDLTNIRKIFNQILTKNKGLSLVENKHGAIQIKRSGDLLFSARGDGMIVTHPMFEGTGKNKIRVFSVKGSDWLNLSRVPFDKVTLAMLQARVDDQKTRADWHNFFYGKKPEESGLWKKAHAAMERAEKVKAAAEKEKKQVKRESKAAKSAKVDIKEKAKAKKPVAGKGALAIQRVAASTGK